MTELKYDIIVLGGGPAGLAAAISAHKSGAKVLLIEREKRLGGILKQCVHDGFGLIRFGERLTGPEYSGRFIREFLSLGIDYRINAFVTDAEKTADGFMLTVQSAQGILICRSTSVIIACGCRERTSRQVFIHGDRPAGIYTAGTAQYFVNILGQMPTRRCVILGSGDIGMIMARRLTLEGASVEGVYEIKDTPAGLARNVHQCLNDFNIPLHLSTTVTKVFGTKRVEAVEVCKVDEKMCPIESTARIIPCDALILSVGLLPENEISQLLSVELDPATKGAIVDQTLMTSIPGVFSCGNALHVNDLVDYVSLSGDEAGAAAAEYCKGERRSSERIPVSYDKSKFLYVVPQYIDTGAKDSATVYFRPRSEFKKQTVAVSCGAETVLSKKFANLASSEMEVLKLDGISAKINGEISITMEDTK